MAKVTKIPTKAMKEAMGLLGLKQADFKPIVDDPDDRPQSATVELAEKLLADVKSGKVVGFAYAAVLGGPGILTGATCSASAFAPATGSIDHKLMVCAIEEMRHEFKHALRGG